MALPVAEGTLLVPADGAAVMPVAGCGVSGCGLTPAMGAGVTGTGVAVVGAGVTGAGVDGGTIAGMHPQGTLTKSCSSGHCSAVIKPPCAPTVF